MDADDCRKLLDNGYAVTLWRNPLGTYSAAALNPGETVDGLPDDSQRITDDFTPAQALYRLTEKVTTGNIVGTGKNWKDRDTGE